MGALSARDYMGLPIVNRPVSRYSFVSDYEEMSLASDEESRRSLPYKRQYLSVFGSFV
jgi:hypothetical protein